MELIKESRKYAISEIEKYGSPPMILFEIAEKKAIELAEKFNADKNIVLIGIYLMDIKLGQALKENKVSEWIYVLRMDCFF